MFLSLYNTVRLSSSQDYGEAQEVFPMVTTCLEFQLLFGSQLPIQVIPAWAQYFLSILLGISAWTCKRAAFSASTSHLRSGRWYRKGHWAF